MSFLFRDNRLHSIIVSDYKDKRVGKVLLVDTLGNEIDILEKYILIQMLYGKSQISSTTRKGNVLAPFVFMNDYDNISTKVTISNRHLVLIFDLLNSEVIGDKLEDILKRSMKLGKIKKYY